MRVRKGEATPTTAREVPKPAGGPRAGVVGLVTKHIRMHRGDKYRERYVVPAFTRRA